MTRSSADVSLREIFPPRRRAAGAQPGAHDKHKGMARGGAAAVGVDRLEDQGAVADGEPGAAVLLGNEGGKVAGLRELVDELLRVFAPGVELAPVLAGEAFADLRHALLERALLVGQCEGY